MLSHALSKASCLLAMLPCLECDQVFGNKSCEASRHGNALLIMFSDILYMFPPPHTSGNYLSGACCFSSPEILHVSFSFLPPSIHCTILEPQVLYFSSNRVQTFSNNICRQACYCSSSVQQPIFDKKWNFWNLVATV